MKDFPRVVLNEKKNDHEIKKTQDYHCKIVEHKLDFFEFQEQEVIV
jgi:hypothetical protein